MKAQELLLAALRFHEKHTDSEEQSHLACLAAYDVIESGGFSLENLSKFQNSYYPCDDETLSHVGVLNRQLELPT